MSACLRAAQQKLCVQTVNLKGSEVYVRDDVDLLSIDRSETASQSFRKIDRIKEIESDIPDSEENVWDYRFVYSIGVRLIFLSEKEESVNDDYKPILEIVGAFEARYRSKGKLEEDELKAFCKDNVGYHVWPYWREYVQSTCARIGFYPGFEVPVYIISQRNDETREDA